MPHGLAERRACAPIPQSRSAVIRRGHDALAVGTELRVVESSIVLHRPAERIAGARVP